MEVVMLTQNINSLFATLGCPIGDDYIVSDDCQGTLEEILSRLYNEDKYVRGFRRLIANSQVLKKDLLPLFYNVKNDHKILDVIIEILENLMIPVECLFPIDIMIREDAGRSTICQLNWLLTSCKEAFLNPCATKSLMDYIKLIMKKEQQRVTTEGCRSITLSLNLLRNLLHIPEVRGGAPGGGASHQNQIIWHLFTQNFDKVLIQLMTCSSRALWSVTLVQLISLMYKDQPSNTIHKLLNTWCDTALSESSEDDESNTSPQGSNGSSSSMATSVSTSDSSSDSDQQRHKRAKHEPEINHSPSQNQIQSQNRMTEIIVNGAGRKAQVAMRNKHGYSSKNNCPIKHRQSESHHIHAQETHMHSNSKSARVTWNTTSESGLGSSVNGSLMMECCSPDGSEYDRERERDIFHSSQNQETISTSSNEDKEPCRFGKKKLVHQKPSNMIQKSRYTNGKTPLNSQARKERLREKLMIRSQATTMSIKAFLNHTPSEDDISHLLKEFTVDFVLKGYGPLVSELKKPEILVNTEVHLDTSHITWLIMFFLRFAAQLELDFQLISPILSYDLISYLTYEGVHLCEELEVTKLHVGENLTITLRKLYLVVASLKEIIFTTQCYKKVNHLSQLDKENLKLLQDKISQTNDLKYLFIMLLRHFDPAVQSHQFLQDLVVANHNLLIIMESNPQVSKDHLIEHIKLFATDEVMKQYGMLLACYEDNGEMVNNCIFTMMHHIAGDLDKVSVLFQPAILKSFIRIMETDFRVCDDWSDLVEYVIQKCLKARETKAEHASSTKNADDTAPKLMPLEISPAPPEEPFVEWSKEDLDTLCWYFPQSLEMQDPVGHICQLFVENCGQVKNRIEIIENLFSQGLIQEDQYKILLKREPDSSVLETIQNKSSAFDILEGIEAILDYLKRENCGFFIKWLQNCLLEVCFAKMLSIENYESMCHLVEPVAYFYTIMKEPVPLVTWTPELWKVMQLEPSIWLLSALNFHLPTRAGNAKIFARIPAEWTPDHLYIAALILGPIDSCGVKFDPTSLEVFKHSNLTSQPMDVSSSSESRLHDKTSLFGAFIGTSTTADWLLKVKQLKSQDHKLQPTEDKHEHMSLNSGDERDWDLTSMCVSDEGQGRGELPGCPV